MTHQWTSGWRGHLLRTVAVLGLFALLLPDRASQAQTSEVQVGQPMTVPLPTGARVDVYAGSGFILLKKGTSTDAVISVVKSKLAADVPVNVIKTAEGITICAVYPSKDPKKPHECLPGGKGRLYAGNPEKLPDIGITVELPDGIAASASIGAGEVRSTAVTGDVSLYSDRGTVTVTDGGVGNIRATVGLLGNIQAGLAAGKQRREVRLNSPGSGRVRVVMPRDLSVRYMISTQRTPRIDPAFGIKVTQGQGLLTGATSPATEVVLTVDTGIAGEFVLQRSAR